MTLADYFVSNDGNLMCVFIQLKKFQFFVVALFCTLQYSSYFNEHLLQAIKSLPLIKIDLDVEFYLPGLNF